MDFSTRGRLPADISTPDSFAAWSEASTSQAEAARRLLYYYGREGDRLVADRLSKLDLTEPAKGDRSATRKWMEHNGIGTPTLILAVAESSSPATSAEVMKIARKTADPDIWLAASRIVAAQDRPFLIHRTLELLRSLPPNDGGGGGGVGFGLVSLLLENASTEMQRECEQFIAAGEPSRIYAVSFALEKHRPAWSTQMLEGQLRDDRVLYEEWRVCDAAARSLHILNPRLRFAADAPKATRDKQIEAIIRQRK